jgi:hypothetical protein
MGMVVHFIDRNFISKNYTCTFVWWASEGLAMGLSLFHLPKNFLKAGDWLSKAFKENLLAEAA